MSADLSGGAWSWSDASGFGALMTFLTVIGGWIHLSGRSTKANEETRQRVDEAHRKVDAVGNDLAEYKLQAVEKFVPRVHLDQVKSEIISRIDQQDGALRTSFGQVTDRLDRILEVRHGDH